MQSEFNVALVLSLAVMAACQPATPPGARAFAVDVPATTGTIAIDGARVAVRCGDGTPQPCRIQDIGGGVGHVDFQALPADVTAANLHIRAEGFRPYDCVLEIPSGNRTAAIGLPLVGTRYRPVGTNGSSCAEHLTALWVDAGERGRLHISGREFVRDDGSIFQWRGTDGFLLYLHWLHEGAGINTVVQNWLTCGGQCPEHGPNLIRVFATVLWTNPDGSVRQRLQPDMPGFFEQLRPFVDHLWSVFHVRVEMVVFTGSEIADRPAFARRVIDGLRGAENVVIEVANEPSINLPGGDLEAVTIGRILQGHGFLVASGGGDASSNGLLDYVTYHGDRGAEWPCKARDLLDVSNASPRPAPVVADEPIGFAEAAVPGSRTAVAEDGAYFAGLSALFVAGATFHNDAGTDYGVMGPRQAAAAKAWFDALAWVPVTAPRAAYQTGRSCGDCPGVGDMPVQVWLRDDVGHEQDGAACVFAKLVEPYEYVIAVRPGAGWTPTPRAGWRIESLGPTRGLVRLARR